MATCYQLPSQCDPLLTRPTDHPNARLARQPLFASGRRSLFGLRPPSDDAPTRPPPPSDETSPSAGSSPAFLSPASPSARAGSFTPLRPGASLAVALSPRQDARRGAQPNMPSPPTRSRRPGPSRHRRLALSLLVASALVSVPQAAALGQDLALGSGGEHLLSESLSLPARPVRPPPAPAAADVGPSIPAGVKPLSVAASPDIAALPSQASSSSGRRLSSTAVIGSGSVDAGDEPGTRRTTKLRQVVRLGERRLARAPSRLAKAARRLLCSTGIWAGGIVDLQAVSSGGQRERDRCEPFCGPKGQRAAPLRIVGHGRQSDRPTASEHSPPARQAATGGGAGAYWSERSGQDRR